MFNNPYVNVPVTLEVGSCSGWAPGDLNYDGLINVLDIVIMVNLILDVEETEECVLMAADLNGDDSINIQDIVLVINLITG